MVHPLLLLYSRQLRTAIRRSPESDRSLSSRTPGAEDRSAGSQLDEIDQQLRSFERNSRIEFQRLDDRIAAVDRSVRRRRAEQRLRAQLQADLAEAIAPAAERMFEYYATQEAGSAESMPSDASSSYLVEVGETHYRVSRDRITGAYAVQREDGQDLTAEDVNAWQAIPGWLDQQEESEVAIAAAPSLDAGSTAPAVFVTLEQARDLTQQEWMRLTPGQQVNLVESALSHQRTEPRVNVQVEQWVGQAKQVQRQLKESRDRYVLEKQNLQALEARGQRSLLNPFGASGDQLCEVRSQLSETKGLWQQAKREWGEIEARQERREQQEAAGREWAARPETQGTRRIIELLRQPELRSQYEQVERTVGQLRQWRKAAGQLGYSANDLEVIGQLTQAYLRGEHLPERAWQAMREGLQRHQQGDRGVER